MDVVHGCGSLQTQLLNLRRFGDREAHMPTFSAEQLRGTVTKVFLNAGAPQPAADRVAESLVLSNLMGVDSHGVMRIPQYLRCIQSGLIDPTAAPSIVRESDTVAIMDGHNAFGQVAAKQAMLVAMQKAQQHAVGVVTLCHVMHIGRLGEWVEMAAEAGLCGLVMCNGAQPGGFVAPYGSRQRLLGTNPIAFAIPAGAQPPLVADFATASIAEGRVRNAYQQGEHVAPGLLLDPEGNPTSNAADFYQGGAIQPFGGHKGYSLALWIEVFGGILSGAGSPAFPDWRQMQNGTFMLALDACFFRPEAEYRRDVDALFSAVTHAKPMPGVERVLLPGGPEARSKVERERDGIPIPDAIWERIRQAASGVGVEL